MQTNHAGIYRIRNESWHEQHLKKAGCPQPWADKHAMQINHAGICRIRSEVGTDMCEEYLTNAWFPQHPLFSELSARKDRERPTEIRILEKHPSYLEAAMQENALYQQKICLSGATYVRANIICRKYIAFHPAQRQKNLPASRWPSCAAPTDSE